MFTINLCRRYSDERIGDLRDYIGTFARFWIESLYGDAMLRTTGPQRMIHLEQILSIDEHLADLTRHARVTMAEPSRF